MTPRWPTRVPALGCRTTARARRKTTRSSGFKLGAGNPLQAGAWPCAGKRVCGAPSTQWNAPGRLPGRSRQGTTWKSSLPCTRSHAPSHARAGRPGKAGSLDVRLALARDSLPRGSAEPRRADGSCKIRFPRTLSGAYRPTTVTTTWLVCESWGATDDEACPSGATCRRHRVDRFPGTAFGAAGGVASPDPPLRSRRSREPGDRGGGGGPVGPVAGRTRAGTSAGPNGAMIRYCAAAVRAPLAAEGAALEARPGGGAH